MKKLLRLLSENSQGIMEGNTSKLFYKIEGDTSSKKVEKTKEII